MKKFKIKEMVKTMSHVNAIDPRFMFALIETESNWNQWAVKYEKQYMWYLHDPALDSFVCSQGTIRTMQSFSYGLCQIMGNHFYEFGYKGFCTQLLDPQLNVIVAINILKQFIKQNIELPEELYAAYNAGSVKRQPNGKLQNQGNVDRFMIIYSNTKV